MTEKTPRDTEPGSELAGPEHDQGKGPTSKDLAGYTDAGTKITHEDAREATKADPEVAEEHKEITTDKRTEIILSDMRRSALVSVSFIAIVAGIALAGYLLKFLWVAILPVILAILFATVLFPVVKLLRRWKFPRALAAATTLLGTLGIVGGVLSAMGPVVASQSDELIRQARTGFNTIVNYIDDLPFDMEAEEVQSAIADAVEFVRGQASNIASGVTTGLSAASSIVLTLVLMLVVMFFILKDGDKFLPWLRSFTGRSMGWHLTELFSRIWRTLAGYIQAQALVSMVDAVFIGLGLWALGVPLAFVLAVVTFFAGFIPIVGAVSAGALAVVIALVTNGLTNALLVLGLVILVQQIEGNVLQPILQSRAMGLHASIVLLAVTVGSTLAGIVGAFLAVPVAATIAVLLRYQNDVNALRAGEATADEIKVQSVHEEQVRALYASLEPADANAQHYIPRSTPTDDGAGLVLPGQQPYYPDTAAALRATAQRLKSFRLPRRR